MPLKRTLNQSRSFDPKAVAILLEAYKGLVGELGLRATAEKERAAKLIIELAQDQTDLDAVKLRDGVAALMLNESETSRNLLVN
jgi:hypothetical protein